MISGRPAYFPVAPPLYTSAPGRISAGGAQWRGTRPEQNDAMFISDWDPQRGLLLAMADGIGLQADAGQAANVAVAAMREDYLRREPMEKIHRQTLRMIGSAHHAVRTMNETNEKPAVGAAAACALIRDRRMSFSSVGNVRLFLCRAGALLQLNRDHLLSLEAEEQAILEGKAPGSDPDWSRKVTAFVGMTDLQKVDCQQSPVALLPGDRVVMISSGLYGVLEEEELAALVREGTPRRAAEAVIRRIQTLEPVSQSNVSVAIALAES